MSRSEGGTEQADAREEMDVDGAFRRLRAQQSKLLKHSKVDQVTILIAAAIHEGFVHGRRIVGVLHYLGYEKQFVGMTLTAETRGRLWSKVDGAYQLTNQTL